MFTHLMDEPFYERMSMFFVFLGVFLVRMSTKRGEGVLHVWLISSIFAVLDTWLDLVL